MSSVAEMHCAGVRQSWAIAGEGNERTQIQSGFAKTSRLRSPERSMQLLKSMSGSASTFETRSTPAPFSVTIPSEIRSGSFEAGSAESLGRRSFRPAAKNKGKMGKSSVPVLSAAKPWFSQGFSRFWPIALEFCSAHATRCMAPAALYFASRTQIRVVFRVARGP